MSTSVESNTKKLTKKQLKTQKLRSGKGKAAEPEQLAVPESDLIGEDIVQKSKKRKRDSNDEGDVDDATVAVEAGQGVAKRKGDGAKSGKSSQQAKPKADKDRKQRFIVFVGTFQNALFLYLQDELRPYCRQSTLQGDNGRYS